MLAHGEERTLTRGEGVGMMRRSFERQPSASHTRGMATLCAALVVAGVVMLAAPASAGSVWDPDDATGPLDIRWMSAMFVDDDTTLRLTISFYSDFAPSALPVLRDRHTYPYATGRGSVNISLVDYYSAFFGRRRDGVVMFVQSEWGSIDRAQIVSANVLRVEVPALTAADLDIETFRYYVQATSYWDSHGPEYRDRTGAITLPVPPG